MRILVVGAGAVGGYFGGRLLQGGVDVTFLVRPRRAALLAQGGLQIQSPVGDVRIPTPPTVSSQSLDRPFDLVILSCKAYDLADAITALAPAVGADTAILPLLNGMRHLDLLDARFGGEKVLGGQCVIASTLDAQGAIVHLNQLHLLRFGERAGGLSRRANAIGATLARGAFDTAPSPEILLEMWEKWVMLAALASATCLMRAPVGDIGAVPGGHDFLLGVLEECRGVAAAAGFEPRPAMMERTRAMITAPGSLQTASMFRDIQRNASIEADHIIGDLVARSTGAVPLLRLAYAHLKAYEAVRAREVAKAA